VHQSKVDTVGHRSKMQLVSKMGGKSKGVNANSTGASVSSKWIADHYANACLNAHKNLLLGSLTYHICRTKAIVWYWCNNAVNGNTQY
jgi:hypothetical protein